MQVVWPNAAESRRSDLMCMFVCVCVCVCVRNLANWMWAFLVCEESGCASICNILSLRTDWHDFSVTVKKYLALPR